MLEFRDLNDLGVYLRNNEGDKAYYNPGDGVYSINEYAVVAQRRRRDVETSIIVPRDIYIKKQKDNSFVCYGKSLKVLVNILKQLVLGIDSARNFYISFCDDYYVLSNSSESISLGKEYPDILSVFKPNYYSVKAGDLYDVLSVILKSNFSLWLAFNVLEEGKILVGSDSELVEVENSFKSSINGLEKPTGVTSSLNSQSVYELKRSTISRRDELAKLYFDIYNSQKGALIYWDVILNAYLLVSDFERFISSRVLSYEMDEVGKCVLRERFEEDDILL